MRSAWTEVLASYFRAGEDLYGYLDGRSHRALPVFAAFFESEEEHGELTPEEDGLLEALTDVASEIVGILEVDAERAYSLDEISRRVYDPFPARFEVETPGPGGGARGLRPGR